MRRRGGRPVVAANGASGPEQQVRAILRSLAAGGAVCLLSWLPLVLLLSLAAGGHRGPPPVPLLLALLLAGLVLHAGFWLLLLRRGAGLFRTTAAAVAVIAGVVLVTFLLGGPGVRRAGPVGVLLLALADPTPVQLVGFALGYALAGALLPNRWWRAPFGRYRVCPSCGTEFSWADTTCDLCHRTLR